MRHSKRMTCLLLTAAGIASALAGPVAGGERPAKEPAFPESPTAMESDPLTQETLPNGATLLLQPRPGCGTFAVAISVAGGGFEDADEHLGLTAVLAQMLLRGTASRSGADVALQVEKTGSSLEAGGNLSEVSLSANGPAEAFAEVFDIAADALLHPRLDAEDLRKEISLEQQSLRTALDNPSTELMRTARPLLFPGHRLGRVADPKTYLTQLTIEPVREAWAKRLAGRRLVVAVVGDLDPVDARRRVVAAFGALPPGEPAVRPFPTPAPLTAEPRGHAKRKTSQPELLVALPTAGTPEADEPTMDLLTQVLGGFQERLSSEIREKRGWAYWVGLVEWDFPGMGLFGVRTAVPKKRLAETEAIIRAELERIASETPSAEEVERSRRFLLTELARNWQQSGTRAAYFASSILHGSTPRSFEEQAARLSAVTPEAVRSLCRRVVDSSKLAVVTVY